VTREDTRLYAWLERLGWFPSYRAKLLFVALSALALPWLALGLALWLAWPVAGVVTLAVALASGWIVWGVTQLLAPLKDVQDALLEKKPPALPPGKDEIGTLALATRHALNALEQQAPVQAPGGHDPLTGLLSRQTVEVMLERQVIQARREGKPFCLALLEIDEFEMWQTRLGFYGCDALLQRVAREVQRELRGSDWVARYQGATLLLVLFAPPSGARGALERLREGLHRTSSPSVTVSIGCVGFQPVEEGAEMLARAVEALERAQQRGRNQVCMLP
jgi:diguanylate cyclase (GGDEF)-like protein